MSENVIIANKELGETPLESLEKARIKHNIDKATPMTYAGRLDPMAEGLIILLVGEECKNKDQYLGLNKTYEFEILVGFDTDTYDLLGLVSNISSITSVDSVIIKSILPSFIGTSIQKYPSFSSKTVEGKQLFKLAKDNQLPKEIPEHEVSIRKLELFNTRRIKVADLQREIIKRIERVKGDFRQEEIMDVWYKVLDLSKEKEFEILSLICECSSGTYIRQLVHDIGKKIGIPFVTYSIVRTQIGEYSLFV